MSFLNQLKSQANALQSQRAERDEQFGEKSAQVETACRVILPYLQDLARQLSVIEPPAPRLTLDGKTPWPAMKLSEFRVDARRKTLRDREVFDYIAVGWNIVPQVGKPVGGVVTVNFPPDLERVEKRLNSGGVKFERKDIRHPTTNALQAYTFEYLTQARGSLTVTAEHEKGAVAFRMVNVAGFGIETAAWPATRINNELMDELAKHLVGQPSRFA